MQLKQYTAQNTLGIAGLSYQLCAEAVDMGFLQKVEINELSTDPGSLVHLYLTEHTVKCLKNVCDDLKDAESLVITTAYRTLAQQYSLKRNLTSLVANVGRSDHGSGKSIDVANYSDHCVSLTSNGFSQSYGDRDAVHFDCDGSNDNRSNTVLAFQKLWNRNNSHKLDEDGICGNGVLMALGNSPVNGFVNAKCQRYLSFQDEGKDVGKAQLRLRDLGHLKASCDGLFGNMTQIAVIAFQSAKGINPTGIIGRATWEALALN